MVKQRNAIRHSGKAMTQQLGQIPTAKVEGETDERGELVVRQRQAMTINIAFGHRQILLQKRFGLCLSNGLALCHALCVTIAYRPDTHAILVGIEAQTLEGLDQL